MIRKEKGITLIALVITIIVLLILAGVSIATLTGANGLLTRANQAREETEMAQLEEKIKLVWSSCEIATQQANNKEKQDVFEDNIITELNEYGINDCDVSINVNGISIIRIKENEKEYTFYIDQNSQLTHVCNYSFKTENEKLIAKCDICGNEVKDVVNVKTFGAIGDGITDDSNSIRQAINNSEGKILYFPSGIYAISNTVTINNINNVNIIGDKDVTLLVNNDNSNCFTFNNVSNFNIKDINFKRSQNTMFKNTLVTFQTPNDICNNIIIQNCSFFDSYYGIKLNTYDDNYLLSNIILDNITIKNCVEPLYMDSVENLTANNVYINQTKDYDDLNKLQHHIYISKNCNNVVFSNTTIDGGIDNSIAEYQNAIIVSTSYENTRIGNVRFYELNVVNRNNNNYYSLISSQNCDNLIIRNIKLNDDASSHYENIIWNSNSSVTLNDSEIRCQKFSLINTNISENSEIILKNCKIDTISSYLNESYWMLVPNIGKIYCYDNNFSLSNVGKNFKIISAMNYDGSIVEFSGNTVEWLSNDDEGSNNGNNILDCRTEGNNIKIQNNKFYANNLCNYAFYISNQIQNFHIEINNNDFYNFNNSNLFSTIGYGSDKIIYNDNRIHN